MNEYFCVSMGSSGRPLESAHKTFEEAAKKCIDRSNDKDNKYAFVGKLLPDGTFFEMWNATEGFNIK